MRLSKIAVVIAALVWCVFPAHAQQSAKAWDFPDFSAIQVFQAPNYPQMKVYRAGSNIRVERVGTTTLYALATSKTYTLTTYPGGGHSCVVMNPNQVHMALPSPLQILLGADLKRTPEGEGVVEGHRCKVESVSTKSLDGTIIRSKVWEAEDLHGVPAKIESRLPSGVRLVAVYRKIELGAPDKALFAPPAKCTPYDKMGQVAEHKVYK